MDQKICFRHQSAADIFFFSQNVLESYGMIFIFHGICKGSPCKYETKSRRRGKGRKKRWRFSTGRKALWPQRAKSLELCNKTNNWTGDWTLFSDEPINFNHSNNNIHTVINSNSQIIVAPDWWVPVANVRIKLKVWWNRPWSFSFSSIHFDEIHEFSHRTQNTDPPYSFVIFFPPKFRYSSVFKHIDASRFLGSAAVTCPRVITLGFLSNWILSSGDVTYRYPTSVFGPLIIHTLSAFFNDTIRSRVCYDPARLRSARRGVRMVRPSHVK